MAIVPIHDFMEFQADDEAWYDVELEFNDDALTVKYNNFSEASNETYQACSFHSHAELVKFRNRFRRSSVQLQDDKCKEVVPGVVVCASHSLRKGEVKLYDAIIDTVHRREHSFVEGHEECSCNFIIVWKHGPLQGKRTCLSVTNIYMTPSVGIHQALASFLKIAQARINAASKKGNTSSARHEVPNTQTINVEAFV